MALTDLWAYPDPRGGFKLAKSKAEICGLTAGRLLKAKQEEYIEAVEPLLRTLVQLGFQLSGI